MSGAQTGTGLVPSAYADAFVRGPPREGAQRVQNRLHKARILADELADYFAARRELESSYLKSLQKIAKRSFLSDASALGPNFMPVYERLISELGEVARIHGDLEKKLEVECELPMRQASQKGDWSRIKEHDDNLASTLKEVATLEAQLAKDQKKVDGASAKKATQAQQKVAETERALRQTMDVWETEAPFSFEAYQRIDASRLDMMREIVTKFETAQSDAAQKIMQMTEQSLQVALNFDTQADMQEFVLKNATAKGALRTASSARQNRPATADANTFGASSARAGIRGASTITPTTTNNNQQSTNGVNEFGRSVQRSSASMHSNDRTDFRSQDQTSTPTRSIGGSTLKSALTRFGRGKSSRNANDSTLSTYGTLPEGPTPMAPPSGGKRMQREGSQRSLDTRSDVADSSAVPDTLMAPMAPTTLTSATAPTSRSTGSAAPQVDSEGFSIPPANRDRKPWENDPASSSLMDDDTPENLDPVNASKVAAMSISRQPIMEDEASDQAALERMRSTLLTARSPAVPPQRRNTTRRDRRDVRNTTYNPMMDDGAGNRMSTFGLPNVATSPLQTNTSAFVGTPGTGPERSQSIVSSASTSNIGNATLESIASSAPIASGLNGQITERVNVVMNGRIVSKIMVVGEISISVRDISANAPIHLRIDEFEQLEKAAVNPQFMKELTGKPGEYTLDLAAIGRQSGTMNAVAGSGRATVLKYQLHVPQHKADQYVPLHIIPQWRCEDNQTSILINYSSNKDSQVANGAQVLNLTFGDAAIQDITMSVDITSPNVNNLMSKPTAIYSAEQKKLYWRLTERLPISNPGETNGTSTIANKALARFQVGNKSEIKPIEIRWKIPGLSVSSLNLSLIDSETVSFGSIARQVVSGKYIVNP